MRYLQFAMRRHTIIHALFISFILFVATVLTLTSVIALAVRIWFIMGDEEPITPFPTLKEYSYIGDDYPSYYPLDIPQVSLTPENTIHYQIFSDDAEGEWASIFPPGGGFVRLGSDGRPFGLALFHQMHCLARIRQAMSVQRSSEHVHHCFNYLRQAILCEANPTVEPVIPILGRRSVNAEIPRVCRDWTSVYDLGKESIGGEGRSDEQNKMTYI